jgi:hypothetical protein
MNACTYEAFLISFSASALSSSPVQGFLHLPFFSFPHLQPQLASLIYKILLRLLIILDSAPEVPIGLTSPSLKHDQVASDSVLHKLGIILGIQYLLDSVLMKGDRLLANVQGIGYLLHRLPLS